MNLQTLENMLLIVINAFWGLSYVFMKLGLGSLQAFNNVGLRFLLTLYSLLRSYFLLQPSIWQLLPSILKIAAAQKYLFTKPVSYASLDATFHQNIHTILGAFQ